VRLFLDANVLFTAAHNPRGKAALVVELAEQGYWSLYSSAYAFEEARRNLARKFPSALERLECLRAAVDLVQHHPRHPFPSGLTAKDQPIFQAAIACQADRLLTGDLKDFGPFMNAPDLTFGVCVETVGDFLAGL
jgi:predicted nucleic acid-binding protein